VLSCAIIHLRRPRFRSERAAMSTTRPDGPDSLFLAQEVDTLCDRYENALRQGNAGPLDGWLPAGNPLRAAALVELVRLDLEHRLRAGEDVRLDDYFNRYPELQADPGAAARLLATERCAQRTGSGPSVATVQDSQLAGPGALPRVGTTLDDF